MRASIMIVFLLICSLTGPRLLAQGNGANMNNNNVVGWNNVPTNLIKEKVDYTDIKGNYFWNQSWLPASVSMENGATYTLTKAKLNLYTNEIHFVNDNHAELAIENKFIKSLTFYSSTDTSKIAIFKNLTQSTLRNRECLTQILVDGKIQFLKKASVKLIKRETDPLLAKTEMIFEPRETYFINYKGRIQELNSISRGNLFELIEEINSDEAWLKAQKNKLRNENEVISFLFYRNTIAE